MSSFDNKFNYLKIPLTDIQTATNNFADENFIRHSRSGKIYKGQLVLSCGKMIDILARRFDHTFERREKEFQTEIMMLSSLKHPNVVSIVGFYYNVKDEEMIIIYKFEANGSLDQYLTDPVALTWTQRLHICLDIARAISYIHYDQQRSFSVIHRDIRSAKILLGDKWDAKLSGFELSMMQPATRRHGFVFAYTVGTLWYEDPEYIASATLSHKSDVYSLGVVLFQVLTGRQALFLTDLARSHFEDGTLNDIIQPGLHDQMDSQALKKFSEAAYWCLNNQRTQRPNIDQLIFALDQALKLQLLHEQSTRAVKDISTNYWKRKNLEHLKIGFDAISSATENFDEKYLIGSGGYGLVYKAELEHFDSRATKGNDDAELPRKRSTVAIKYILNREDTQGEQGFFTEIEILGSCMHPNIVSLLGFCCERPHMILVYEYVSNGSLDDYLHSEGKKTNFTWVQRIKICIDIARGLDYIHTNMDYKHKIIHRDIKSANILLDEKWGAKIADFGLSKFHTLDHTASTINTTNIAGTQVYLDPEYETKGKLKKESDVYSFGVVLFEILSGRLAYDPVYTNKNEKGLAPIVRQHFEKGTIKEMIDPNLKEENTFTLSRGPNQNSLDTFSLIGYKCLAEKQADRPTMEVVIEELKKALNFEEIQTDSLRMSFEDIRQATQNFNSEIGRGTKGIVYRGEILSGNGATAIDVRRYNEDYEDREREFLTEVHMLYEYKHDNIIGLIGYCNENKERILVYERATKGSLNRHLKDARLTWTKRLKIGIDVATGLEFLHGRASPVIHRDINSYSIILTGEWKAKIRDFGCSIITPINDEIDFVVDKTYGIPGYCDPMYEERGLLTRESDIYSLGVVLFEMMCGRPGDPKDFADFVKCRYEKAKVDELVFEGIKDQTVPKSLIAFQRIAYQCLRYEREERPTATEVALQLKRALEFHEDIEIWKAKLPPDYKKIIQMSANPEKYSNVSNKGLGEMLSKGILLQKGTTCLSVNSNGERNEMVSATMFSYENNRLHNKRMPIQNSRFHRVVKMMDVSNLKIQVKIKTQFLSPNVIYGAHLVFKFCNPIKISSKLMYVNLKYKMGSEILHAYFSTFRNEWMMIELCRFIPRKKDVNFEVLLLSLSRYYCGSGEIYLEGVHFQAINDATLKPEVYEKLKGVQGGQQALVDYDEITRLDDEKMLFSVSKANEKNCHMLTAKMVLYESSDLKCFNWKSLTESEPESRFLEVAELLSYQVFKIKCKIEAQKLSPDTNYACHLVFNLSQKCHGLQCPVKLQDTLLRKNKDSKFLYFRSPRIVNFHGDESIPYHREDGLMEVVVWEINSGNKQSDDHVHMSLKLRCYEGTMSGLIVYGIEFRPI